MKRKFLYPLCLWLLSTAVSTAQPTWPKEIKTKGGAKITIYQPTPENLSNNVLKARAAISVETKPGADLIFGAIWTTAKVATDRETRMVELESIKVDNVKFPDVTDTSKINQLKRLLEAEIPKWGLKMSLDELVATIEQENPQKGDALKTDPPKVIYTDKPSTLVSLDGEPKVEVDKNINNIKRVINTPFLIVQDESSSAYYLTGGKFWYTSKSIKEGWTSTTKLPATIAELDKQIKAKSKESQPDSLQPKSPPAIVVVTEPTELIQSDGKAVFKPIETTNLLYVDNSEDFIFMEINSQQYYILISGRWYQSKSLQGPWAYVDADKIHPDFAKIPEGSDLDVVLASVPGTPAAKEAVMDAQIPQTAKVDVKKASTEVKYDGEPKFEKIEGTDMEVAKNTSSTVIKDKGKYYAVEDGIWFMATVATGGLWAVAHERPSQMEEVPPSSEVYNAKYVYVYESTPDYVYVGYTPGYLGCFVFGPTVVYGTGFYYSPWFGPHYYPHPVTYGYGMAYNPYLGFSMGVAFSMGCFAFHSAYHCGYGYHGPHGYHPPYGYHGGGHYGHHVNHYGNTNINVDRSNNVYRNNGGAQTKDIKRGTQQPAGGGRGSSASQQPAGGGRGSSASQQPAGGGRGSSASQQPAGGTGGGRESNASQQPAGGAGGDRGPGASQQPAGGTGGDRGPGASQQPAGGTGGDRGPGASQQPAGGGDRGSQPGASQQPAGGSRGDRPSQQPGASQQPAGGANNVKTDRDGNVYRQNNDGSVQQRNNNQWQNSNSNRSNNQVNQQYQNSNRGQTRNSNFNSQGGGQRYSGGGGGGASRGGGGGGGSRGGGGGRGGGGRR